MTVSDSAEVLGVGDLVAAVGALDGVWAGGDGEIPSGAGRLTGTAAIGIVPGGATIPPRLTSTLIDGPMLGISFAQ